MKNILTIHIEDYYQVGAFSHLIPYQEWERFEDRIRRNTNRALELLDETGTRATFFVSGWIAEKHADLLRSIVAAGHEIAAQGYYQHSIRNAPPGVFRDDVRRTRQLIEQAVGHEVLGFRVGRGWIGPDDLWALDVLEAEHFTYDSSICPIGTQFEHEPERHAIHRAVGGSGEMLEIPVSSTRIFGHAVPFAGGNYLRQLPLGLTRRAARAWVEQRRQPLVMYFHIWELDDAQPSITAANALQRLRHYRNLAAMRERIGYLLKAWPFTSVQDYLQLSQTRRVEPAVSAAPPGLADSALSTGGPPVSVSTIRRVALSIIVPCFNEQDSLAYLARTLDAFRAATAARLDLEFVFVDDGSTDETWAGLQAAFSERDDCVLSRHAENRGIAGAIMSGAAESRHELIAVLDADCTFDPFQIEQMLAELHDDVTVVVASPFHADGAVRNVPGWRLLLSRTATVLYQRVFHNRLSSYTSCFRIYRRTALSNLVLSNTGFCGVTEIIARLDLAGHRIVECPVVLQVRLLGQSKIRLLRVSLDHLELLGRLVLRRFFGVPLLNERGL